MRGFFTLLARNRLALGGLIVMGAVVLLALITPILPLADPNVTDTANRFKPPFCPSFPGFELRALTANCGATTTAFTPDSVICCGTRCRR